ncbi:DUF4912 domain-containing protein [Treponema sp.]|uniref:DUF4912 domain-containing protein n=1 Tax=Treponema sp. TaxID=166 RepID=UPI0025FD30C4|nr:DUF4912 domain-containing protein [Treponema sp.]MCR5219164.1 DUF4912 domain-containing protein [Treponema sp.]
MEEVVLSRQNLESLSTADLITLARTYGINVPSTLNRNFIIGELLEIPEEADSATSDSTPVENSDLKVATVLPSTYNDTTVHIFMRNPVWMFAYWDIKDSDIKTMKEEFDFDELFLHISFFNNENDEKSFDSFDVKLNFENKELYILIPANRHYVMATLAYKVKGEQPRTLAYTKKLEIPQEDEAIRNHQPGKKFPMSELTRISGMEQLLNKHYMTHRQSFSN